jgi:hypothetical protein
VEALSETTKTYTPLELSSDAYESDQMLPPFLKASAPCKILLLVHMDAENPTMEARWVKSGDLQEWLKAMFGRMFWGAETSNGWEKKIEVVDPDPVRDILSSVLIIVTQYAIGSHHPNCSRWLGNTWQCWDSDRTTKICPNTSHRNRQYS